MTINTFFALFLAQSLCKGNSDIYATREFTEVRRSRSRVWIIGTRPFRYTPLSYINIALKLTSAFFTVTVTNIALLLTKPLRIQSRFVNVVGSATIYYNLRKMINNKERKRLIVIS